MAGRVSPRSVPNSLGTWKTWMGVPLLAIRVAGFIARGKSVLRACVPPHVPEVPLLFGQDARPAVYRSAVVYGRPTRKPAMRESPPVGHSVRPRGYSKDVRKRGGRAVGSSAASRPPALTKSHLADSGSEPASCATFSVPQGRDASTEGDGPEHGVLRAGQRRRPLS